MQAEADSGVEAPIRSLIRSWKVVKEQTHLPSEALFKSPAFLPPNLDLQHSLPLLEVVEIKLLSPLGVGTFIQGLQIQIKNRRSHIYD